MKRVTVTLTPPQREIVANVVRSALDGGWTGRRARIAARALDRLEAAPHQQEPEGTATPGGHHAR